MSVPYYKRHESKAEYVNAAYMLNNHVLELISRLSARYSRLLADDIKSLSVAVISECEQANSIVPSTKSVAFKQDMLQRRTHLLEARGKLLSLDVQLGICFEVLVNNPQGCFSNSHGDSLSADDAIKKLDKLSTDCGLAYEKLLNLLNGVIRSDMEKLSSILNGVNLPDYDPNNVLI